MVVAIDKRFFIDYEICNPNKCEFECLEVCPVTKRNPDNPAIFNQDGKPVIVEDLCTSCNRCQRSCPLGAIFIEGTPKTTPIDSDYEFKPVNLKSWKSIPFLIDTEIYIPFSQENTIFARVMNDPEYIAYQKGIYSEHEEIFEQEKSGYSRVEAALSAAAWTVHDKFSGAFSWGDIDVAEGTKFDEGFNQKTTAKYIIEDPTKMSKVIKHVAKSFGAAKVGVAKYNPNWVYTKDRKGNDIEIPNDIENVIVIAVEMDLEALQSSPAFPSAFATGNGYSRMAFIQSCLAEFIRNLGYKAIPAGNGIGLSVPMAIEAGLGQYGRHGLLITEEYGSNVRLCKVFTDMPLSKDRPINLGTLEFCRTCMKCAESCPSNSITTDVDPTWTGNTKSNNPGIYKWYVNVETCYEFWTKNGNDCSNCIVACPFTKNKHWSHKIARVFIKRMPFLNRLWVKLDDLMGYGKQRDAEEFWDEDKKFIHTRSDSKT